MDRVVQVIKRNGPDCELAAVTAQAAPSRKSECPTETPDHVSGQPRSVLSRPSRETRPAEMSR